MIKRLLFVACMLLFGHLVNAKPKITVVMVIDQFAAHYLPKLDPYLSHGFYNLLRNGVVYTNAYLPYATTSTAVGHASIGTGALPKDHGIIYNKWLDQYGNKVAPEDDNGKNIMLPTLNAPFLAENKNNKALAISFKPRATFGMAGKTAAAIWFNESTAQFETNSNSSLINKILAQWNKKIKNLSLSWKPIYNDERYYQFPHIHDYRYASEPKIINTQASPTNPEEFSERFTKLPIANETLLDMATEYIKQQYQNNPDGNILLWISLSPLDKVGHIYGPYSQEVVDMIYQLDHQIDSFMNNVNTITSDDTLYVLTADHGVMPIPELIKDQHPSAFRLDEERIVKSVNNKIKKKLGYNDAIACLKVPHVFCNKKLIKKLSPDKKNELLNAIKQAFRKAPGIQNIYTEAELLHMNPPQGTVQWLLKNNVYPTRSGDLLVEIKPYTIISKYTGGTKHLAPYSYNTHVPLIIYQKGLHERKVISQKLWMPQVTATLANALEIPQPSEKVLPALPL
ncbi:TPA: hypothetical protein DIC20_01770 [Candidatus Dependentiae bacterium]|nr:MAG: hypothetical protein US03_C0001G0193 [candidate division TM6 bacterium GW2011_GWF2_36_131]KKQ03671.1 MAG: hypothetical protein US13_C0001G0011 [candidate division TM6 bacterium GW2011_GWE2_36_25]KKQ20093.1 MAG: hypothetical protein US32_C0002G0098 [candidate division TM6 bacterium GW2011_GWA2_36_9]HBR70438.1 hypothetical protein [Candidatus Dependentiae bacterium]HCU00414.1 hypothetical protein [Candidatus Dependentiae bacterium]